MIHIIRDRARERKADLEAGARGDVRLADQICIVGRASLQHEAPVAIAAIDIAMLVNLKEHARMAKRGGNAMP